MAKVFISHSFENKELAEYFVEFLQLGMGVQKQDIFCTMQSGCLTTGEDFVTKIKQELTECNAVVSLITEEYLQSKFCLVEMGAVWALSKRYFPLITVPFEQLDRTPLHGLQMRKLNSKVDLSIVYDEFYECEIRTEHSTAEFNKRLEDFIYKVDKILGNNKKEKEIVDKTYAKEEHDSETKDASVCVESNNASGNEKSILKNKDGYYIALIEQCRVVKGNYRCYKIKGQIADPPDHDIAFSDWLLYRKDAFTDLEEGDLVEFKISKSEVKVFSDIGRARSLYPVELRIIEKK